MASSTRKRLDARERKLAKLDGEIGAWLEGCRNSGGETAGAMLPEKIACEIGKLNRADIFCLLGFLGKQCVLMCLRWSREAEKEFPELKAENDDIYSAVKEEMNGSEQMGSVHERGCSYYTEHWLASMIGKEPFDKESTKLQEQRKNDIPLLYALLNALSGRFSLISTKDEGAEFHDRLAPVRCLPARENERLLFAQQHLKLRRMRKEFIERLEQDMKAFVSEGVVDLPGGIRDAISMLDETECECFWNKLRMVELSEYAKWVVEFRDINKKISIPVEFSEKERKEFSEYGPVLEYFSQSGETLSGRMAEAIQKLEMGKPVTIDGKENAQYEVGKTEKGYSLVKRECVFCCHGNEISDVTASRTSFESFSRRLERIDALFSLVGERSNAAGFDRKGWPERNRHGIVENVLTPIELLLQG